MKNRAQTSMITVALMLCIIAVSSILTLALLYTFMNTSISAKELELISKISTSIEASSELIYNKTSGYAYLLLRIINLGQYPITISSVTILNCTNNNIMQILKVTKGKEIFFKKTVVLKENISIPTIETIESSGFLNVSVLLNNLEVDSISDHGFVRSEIYVFFISPESSNSLILYIYNISILLNIVKSSSGRLEAIFTIFDNFANSVISSRIIPLEYGIPYNFNITVYVKKLNVKWLDFLTEYRLEFLGYFNGKLMINKTYIAILGGRTTFRGRFWLYSS